MIVVENLSFTYRKSKREVLRDFSLSFKSGRVYGLLEWRRKVHSSLFDVRVIDA